MSDRHRPEIARMGIVRIEHHLFQDNFRVNHIKLKCMQSGLINVYLRHQPPEIVKHLVATEPVTFQQCQTVVARRNRLERRRSLQICRRIFSKLIMKPLSCIYRYRCFVIHTVCQPQSTGRHHILCRQYADTNRLLAGCRKINLILKAR